MNLPFINECYDSFTKVILINKTYFLTDISIQFKTLIKPWK